MALTTYGSDKLCSWVAIWFLAHTLRIEYARGILRR